jgi:hypothetical protein
MVSPEITVLTKRLLDTCQSVYKQAKGEGHCSCSTHSKFLDQIRKRYSYLFILDLVLY